MPVVHTVPLRVPERGFTVSNTSGLAARELAALNRALDRLMAAGLSEQEAKVKLDHAVRVWLEPAEAGEMAIERLLKGHGNASIVRFGV